MFSCGRRRSFRSHISDEALLGPSTPKYDNSNHCRNRQFESVAYHTPTFNQKLQYSKVLNVGSTSRTVRFLRSMSDFFTDHFVLLPHSPSEPQVPLIVNQESTVHDILYIGCRPPMKRHVQYCLNSSKLSRKLPERVSNSPYFRYRRQKLSTVPVSGIVDTSGRCQKSFETQPDLSSEHSTEPANSINYLYCCKRSEFLIAQFQLFLEKTSPCLSVIMILLNYYRCQDEPIRFFQRYCHYQQNYHYYNHHQQHQQLIMNYHGQRRLPYNFMHCTFCVLYCNGYLELQDYAKQQEIKHRRKVILPCVIPWEYGSNKYASQKGTGGFGTIRNASEFCFFVEFVRIFLTIFSHK